MDTEYIVLEEISIIDLTIVGCPLVHLEMIAHKGSAEMELENAISDDAVIVSIKLSFNIT